MRIIYWIDHLFWCLGKLYLSLLRIGINDAIDILYFIRIHLCFKDKRISKVEMPFKIRFKNLLISLFGLIVSVLIIIGLCNMCLVTFAYTVMFVAFVTGCIRVYYKTK